MYRLTEGFPKEEEFGLKAQLRRAAISVPSNLAEGLTRASRKEKLHFLNIADGSLSEIDAQMEIARMLGYVQGSQFENCETTLVSAERLIGGLRRNIAKG